MMQLQKQLAKVLNLGGFHLTKWISNKEKANTRTGKPFLCQAREGKYHNACETCSSCHLGHQFRLFVFKAAKRNMGDTHRKTPSLKASLFDPIGFLAPFLVRGKIVIKQVWQFGICWDVLPSEFLEELYM